jgi:hypothetical protein
MDRIIAFLKKKDLYLGVIRYILGIWMITYAVVKILRVQFVIIPFSMWQQPLESLTGRTIAWAFLGYSPWFQMLLGFLEFIPALLLLFRRTTLLGGILLLPVTLNVLLINYALNLWDGTKLIAVMIFALNCLVLLFEWKRIWELAMIVIGKGKRLKFSALEICINLVLAIGVVWFIAVNVNIYKKQTNALTGDWYNKHPYEWTLQSEKIGDSILPHRLMKSYFGSRGKYSEINDTGLIKGNTLTYSIDEKTHQLNFYSNGYKLVNKWTYTLLGDTGLKVESVIDSLKNTRMVQVFKKRVINEKSSTKTLKPLKNN